MRILGRVFGFLLIGLGLFLIAYLSVPMLFEGHIITAIFFAFPGGLPLGAGLGLLQLSEPAAGESSGSEDPPRG